MVLRTPTCTHPLILPLAPVICAHSSLAWSAEPIPVLSTGTQILTVPSPDPSPGGLPHIPPLPLRCYLACLRPTAWQPFFWEDTHRCACPAKGVMCVSGARRENPLGPQGSPGLFSTQSPSQYTSCWQAESQASSAVTPCYTASFFTESLPQPGRPQLGGAPE